LTDASICLRGTDKVKCVVLLFALAHNLMRAAQISTPPRCAYPSAAEKFTDSETIATKIFEGPRSADFPF
jgi:hypothetical protein